MKTHRCISISVAATASLLALALAAPAQAQDVFWSIGLSSPGVQVGVSSAPQVLMQPVYQPHVRMAPPVLVLPRPVVYVRPAPMVYAPAAPVVVVPASVVRVHKHHPGQHRGWQHQHDQREVLRDEHDRHQRRS